MSNPEFNTDDHDDREQWSFEYPSVTARGHIMDWHSHELGHELGQIETMIEQGIWEDERVETIHSENVEYLDLSLMMHGWTLTVLSQDDHWADIRLAPPAEDGAA